MSENNGNYGLRLKTGLAEMLKGGVIMDVMTPPLKIGRAHV